MDRSGRSEVTSAHSLYAQLELRHSCNADVTVYIAPRTSVPTRFVYVVIGSRQRVYQLRFNPLARPYLRLAEVTWTSSSFFVAERHPSIRVAAGQTAFFGLVDGPLADRTRPEIRSGILEEGALHVSYKIQAQ